MHRQKHRKYIYPKTITEKSSGLRGCKIIESEIKLYPVEMKDTLTGSANSSFNSDGSGRWGEFPECTFFLGTVNLLLTT